MRSSFGDLWRYAVSSAFSFAFVIAATAFFHELVGLSESVAPIPALALAFAANFTLLRRWVFPGQRLGVGRQALETALTSAAFRVLEYGIFLALHLGADVDYLVATGASLCISFAGKFFVYRQLVFNPARGSARP
ncbi:MAG: GtrA family protein [Solirubrobacterales bacterium]